VSTALLLVGTSPELSWDEADYLRSIRVDWSRLWAVDAYPRHAHGPLAIYLAKLGDAWLSPLLSSREIVVRFFPALVGSTAVGVCYAALRHGFRTSAPAAITGALLLALSGIRITETNVIGPHHLLLGCSLALTALAFAWRDEPTSMRGLLLGAVVGVGVATSPYIIPIVCCVGAGLLFIGNRWAYFDRGRPTMHSALFFTCLGIVLVASILWRPVFVDGVLLQDFNFYRTYGTHATLVRDQIYDGGPRWAVGYWLSVLELPLLIMLALGGTAAISRRRSPERQTPEARYLAVVAGALLAVLLIAHIAGARNLLQLVGVLALLAGVLTERALSGRTPRAMVAAIGIACGAFLHLAWRVGGSYTPYLATDGYNAFVASQDSLLSKPVNALVYGRPVLAHYAATSGRVPTWQVAELPWTTSVSYEVPDDVRFILAPSFVFEGMPEQHALRRQVVGTWQLRWRHDSERAWSLYLYERPTTSRPPAPQQE